MAKLRLFIIIAIVALAGEITAQNIYYSDPDRTDPKTLQFELIGKLGGQFLVYKSYRDQHFIYVYDNGMRTLDKV
ncbi:MAG: hypothetical protein IM577_07600 [Chitinophagaceae bacterium]|nr:hypothetical protein [Chitinophagaceae bacterium]